MKEYGNLLNRKVLHVKIKYESIKLLVNYT